MSDAPYRRAAFINAIAEEGMKQEAVQWLQTTWNERCELADALEALQAENARLREALDAAKGIVHKAQVSATMELLNMSESAPIFAQVEAWRRRCVQCEQDIVDAMGETT